MRWTDTKEYREGRLVAWFGISCAVAAVLTGILKGLWTIQTGIYATPEAFSTAPAATRWAQGVLEVVKTVGFLAGLYAFYLAATKRGRVTKAFLLVAVLGGIFFSAVHLWMAAAAHFTLVYVLGGMWYQMVAPAALGIAALFARRVAWWKSAWAVVVGVLNAQIFPLLGPEKALIAQGVIWFIFGCIVYSLRRAGTPSTRPV